MNDAVAVIVDEIAKGHDGGTVSTLGKELPVFGYWVGLHGFTVKPDHDAEHLAHLVQRLIEDSQARWIGFWLNPEDGLYYVDAVRWCVIKSAAALVAVQYEQLAYYDIKAQADIEV